MSYQAALERALKALAAKGQSATVAKIKAQLDTQVPLPLIIQAVKSAKKISRCLPCQPPRSPCLMLSGSINLSNTLHS
ncbi:hypothetical protein [Salinivibrio costicola]|uniref:hypothetical protein n=1 Tax=Salinivibrio costicola TaxID=51367 RepID=UPI003F731056